MAGRRAASAAVTRLPLAASGDLAPALTAARAWTPAIAWTVAPARTVGSARTVAPAADGRGGWHGDDRAELY